MAGQHGRHIVIPSASEESLMSSGQRKSTISREMSRTRTIVEIPRSLRFLGMTATDNRTNRSLHPFFRTERR